MEHTTKRFRFPLLICLLGMVGFLAGCAAAAGTLGYMIYGDDVDPPCKDLKGKVAIICRPQASMTYQNGDTAAQLGRSVNVHIMNKLKKKQKVELIPQREIEKYCDVLDSELDFEEIGQALGADQVIAIDLYEYTHIEGTGTFRGQARVGVRLIDIKTGNELYESTDFSHTYPQNHSYSESEMRDEDFQRLYLGKLGYFISKNFVPYSRWDRVDI